MMLKGKLHLQENQWGINYEDTSSWTSRWHLVRDVVFYPLHAQSTVAELEEGAEVNFEVTEDNGKKFATIIKNKS